MKLSELTELTNRELKNILRENQIKNYSKLNKKDLVKKVNKLLNSQNGGKRNNKKYTLKKLIGGAPGEISTVNPALLTNIKTSTSLPPPPPPSLSLDPPVGVQGNNVVTSGNNVAFQGNKPASQGTNTTALNGPSALIITNEDKREINSEEQRQINAAKKASLNNQNKPIKDCGPCSIL